MNEIEAIRARHSVRNYQDRKIDEETARLLTEKIRVLNGAGNLHLQFLPDAAGVFSRLLNKAMGLSSAPSVIACVGPEGEDLEERIGYYGEALVLYAQTLGLNTCWAGIYNRRGVPAEIGENERLVIVIAVGYGVTQGSPRRSKTAEQVLRGTDRPAWLEAGVEAALLAPTAMNQQKFDIVCENGEASLTAPRGAFTGVDLGIVKYHFDAGVRAWRQANEPR